MYLLDTNICIALMKGNRAAIKIFNRVFPQCYTSTVVIAELYKGICFSQRTKENLQSLVRLTELLDVESFDRKAAAEFGQIQKELRDLGKPTGEMDALIASVARSRGDVLVTNNTRDFINIPQLILEDWLQP